MCGVEISFTKNKTEQNKTLEHSPGLSLASELWVTRTSFIKPAIQNRDKGKRFPESHRPGPSPRHRISSDHSAILPQSRPEPAASLAPLLPLALLGHPTESQSPT